MSRALSLRRSISHLLHRRPPSNPISTSSTFPPTNPLKTPINPNCRFSTSSPSPAPASSEAERSSFSAEQPLTSHSPSPRTQSTRKLSSSGTPHCPMISIR
ncbi:hypothetical protein LINPERPRIM_LOCUS9339 [Linum perenne]